MKRPTPGETTCISTPNPFSEATFSLTRHRALVKVTDRNPVTNLRDCPFIGGSGPPTRTRFASHDPFDVAEQSLGLRQDFQGLGDLRIPLQ